MVRRLFVLVAVLGLVAVTAGCAQMSQAAGGVAGCRGAGCGGGATSAQFKSYARQWSRDLQHQQEFIDTYFLNHDVNDPYRCTCPVYDYCP
jgi:hypothetical protein